MVFLTDSSSRLDAVLCGGLFIVCSRRNGITHGKESLYTPLSSAAPVRGGSTMFGLYDLDQEGTRYGN
jgi:hypothetical protein